MSESLERTLGRIEGRLAGIEAEQRRIADVVDSQFKDMEKRVTALEHTRTRLTAWASGIGLAVGAVSRVLFP